MDCIIGLGKRDCGTLPGPVADAAVPPGEVGDTGAEPGAAAAPSARGAFSPLEAVLATVLVLRGAGGGLQARSPWVLVWLCLFDLAGLVGGQAVSLRREWFGCRT